MNGSRVIAAALLCVLACQPRAAQDQVFEVGGDVTAPRVIHRVTPEMPEMHGPHSMTVIILRCVVARDGSVREVVIVRGPKNEFSAAITDAIKKWRFEPGRRNGEPVDVFFNMSMNHVPYKVGEQR